MRRLIIFFVSIVVVAFAVATKGYWLPSAGKLAYERMVPDRTAVDLIASLDEGLHVVLCGSGSPMPDPSRKGPCTAVIAGDRLFVVDVGSGAGRNFGPMGISPGRAEAVLLTHYHSDHISGVGEFMIQRWANSGSSDPLSIIGPSGVRKIADSINAAYDFDRQYRMIHHGSLMPEGGYGLNPTEFTFGSDDSRILLDEGGLRILAFKVEHGGIDPAVGYRFDYRGRSVVVSGDTSFSENLIKHARDADILVHEAMNDEMIDTMSRAFAASDNERLSSIFQEIKAIHTTPADAGKAAARAGVDLLLLTHIIPPAPKKFLDPYFSKGTREQFDGEIVVGRDGMMLSLPAQTKHIERSSLL